MPHLAFPVEPLPLRYGLGCLSYGVTAELENLCERSWSEKQDKNDCEIHFLLLPWPWSFWSYRWLDVPERLHSLMSVVVCFCHVNCSRTTVRSLTFSSSLGSFAEPTGSTVPTQTSISVIPVAQGIATKWCSSLPSALSLLVGAFRRCSLCLPVVCALWR